jgi:hypothetical protein
MNEAVRYLGVSKTKIWRLVKSGTLTTPRNPLDQRQKLIRTVDLEKLVLAEQRQLRFVSDGIVNDPDAPNAATIGGCLAKHWQT